MLATGTGAALLRGVSLAPILIPRPPPSAVEKKKLSPRIGLAMAAGFLVAVVVSGGLGYLAARSGVDFLLRPPGPKALKLVALAILPMVWLVVVGFHELGHLVGGWAGGGKFLLWIVGPFLVRRTPGGIRFAFNRNINLAGGMAACLPIDPALMTPRRVAVMILGGPVASLVLAVAALWTAAWLGEFEGTLTVARALAQNAAMFTAGMSAMIFLVTAMPSATGGFKSDGKRVFELMRGGPRSEQEAAVLLLTTASLAGIRPADYDPELVARAIALGDGSLFDLYGRFTAYFHAADRGKWATAQAHLDHALAGESKVAPYIRDCLRCEYAWLLATQSRDVAFARAWLDTAGRLAFDPATRLRAEAAVLLAEGRAAEAAAKARAGLHALQHKSLSPAKNLFAQDALEELVRRAGG